MNKAILFDLDGTLWDTVKGVVCSWNEVLAAHPEAHASLTCEDMCSYMGKTTLEIARLMIPGLTDEERMVIMDECAENEHRYLHKNHAFRLFEGIAETLPALARAYPLYIISNCQSGYIELFLELTGFEKYFSGHTCPGDTGMTKGDNIRLILDTHHIDRAFYLGDTTGDERASRHAGIPFVHAAYGFGSADAPDAVLERFADLPALADKLLS